MRRVREAGKIRTGAFRKPSTGTDKVFPTAGFFAGVGAPKNNGLLHAPYALLVEYAG